MTFSLTYKKVVKNSVLLLSALLIIGCQPPDPAAQHPASDSNENIDSPIITDADSVTMAAEYILSIKPSRYQPSLGLQGSIEPLKQAHFKSGQVLTVQQVLIKEGQWVEKGTPLLVVQRQTTNDEALENTSASKDSADSSETTDKSNSTAKVDDASAQDTAVVQQHQVGNDTDENVNLAASSTPKDNDATRNSTNINTDETNKAAVKSIKSTEKIINVDKQNQPITIYATFTGRIDNLYVAAKQSVEARKPLLDLVNDTDLRFIATLPLKAESQLSVGQHVTFSTENSTDKFTGQVSKLTHSVKPNQLLVYVHVINNEDSQGKLKPNMTVSGQVSYGQIEVGTIVPKRAIHDADLSALKAPPYRPLTPLAANIWIIQQDQRLTRQPVEVIEYDPSTGQYLIAGINNDSLICLTDLPLESAGKKVVVS